MEKTINIDGKEVRLRATAAVPRLYRIKFGRDIMQWCCTIKVDIENSKGQYIEKDKQEATKDGSESTKIQHGI